MIERELVAVRLHTLTLAPNSAIWLTVGGAAEEGSRVLLFNLKHYFERMMRTGTCSYRARVLTTSSTCKSYQTIMAKPDLGDVFTEECRWGNCRWERSVQYSNTRRELS